MNYRYLRTPCAARLRLYCAPGSLILKLVLGEAPEVIPAAADVRRGSQEPADRLHVPAVDRVLRHFSPEVRIARVHCAAARLGHVGHQHADFDDLEHVFGLARTFRVEITHDCSITDVVDALRQVAVVEQASPHYLCTLPFEAVQPLPVGEAEAWAARRQISAAEALAYEAGDPSVVVGLADTGVLETHPELQDRLRTGLDTVQLMATQLASGVELVGDVSTVDLSTEDPVGHGTACAGIIAARGDHIPPGLAGDCRILPMRVLGAARFPGKKEAVGIGAIADIDQGLKAAIDLGAKVINMSFGTPQERLEPDDPIPHSDVVSYGLARNCIMVAASGNSGRVEAYSPASLPGVIAVGAAGPDNHAAPFSTAGDHVALAAPGMRVVSAGLDGYALVTGTSFAAPFVTAAAGLLVSRAARRAYPLDGQAVRRILCASADPWPDPAPAGQGVGVLNAYAALQLLDREIDRASVLSV